MKISKSVLSFDVNDVNDINSARYNLQITVCYLNTVWQGNKQTGMVWIEFLFSVKKTYCCFSDSIMPFGYCIVIIRLKKVFITSIGSYLQMSKNLVLLHDNCNWSNNCSLNSNISTTYYLLLKLCLSICYTHMLEHYTTAHYRL